MVQQLEYRTSDEIPAGRHAHDLNPSSTTVQTVFHALHCPFT